MSYRILISNILPGGDRSDNPVPLTIDNYELSDAEKLLKLIDFDVIAFNPQAGAQKQVTGKIIKGKTGPNDIVFMPCPPFCY